MPFHGTFHRLESTTQTVADAIRQVNSGEIWGRTPRHGFTPTVQAYAGHISIARRGVQFDTHIEPHPTGSPLQAHWYLGKTAGVLERTEGHDTFAAIPAAVTNLQP